MREMRFLTVFPNLFQKGLGSALLYKDVGAIPFYMAKACGWKAFLVFIAPERNSVKDENYEREVSLIPLKRSTSRFINSIRLGLFLCKKARQYDVVNFYHDSPLNTVYAFFYKLFNPDGTVYIKLDLDHFGVEKIINNHHHFLSLLKLSIKHFLSIYAVDLYSAECTETFDVLKNVFHYHKRLLLIPNGFTPEIDITWSDMSVKENIIITVGRLGLRQKNNELLIDALTKIDINLLDGWKVYFVGPIQQDSFSAYVEHIYREYPMLKDIIILTGNIQEKVQLYDLYRRAKIFCLTSRWEGFSLVLPEAMYFGCYVISSDLPSSRDLTKQACIGALFPSEDAAKLALLLEEAMTGRIDVQKLSLESHQYIKEQYNWPAIVTRLERHFFSKNVNVTSTKK